MGEKVKDSSSLKLCKLVFIYKALSVMIPPFSKSSSNGTLPARSIFCSEALSLSDCLSSGSSICCSLALTVSNCSSSVSWCCSAAE